MRTVARLSPPRPRPRGAHKASVGRVLVVGGSRDLTGAPWLSGRGALEAGAGLVRVAVPAGVQRVVAGYGPDLLTAGLVEARDGGLAAGARARVRTLAAAADAVVLGPGAGRSAGTQRLLRTLTLDLALPLVLDADALFAWDGRAAGLASRQAPTVLTPHEGEAARLLGLTPEDVRRDRRGSLAELVRVSGAVVVLKGPGTLVSDGRRVYRCPHGGPVLATGGTGDVLAGVVAALLAEAARAGREDAFTAAATAVEWHARAGDLCARCLGRTRGAPASALPSFLAPALSAWRRER